MVVRECTWYGYLYIVDRTGCMEIGAPEFAATELMSLEHSRTGSPSPVVIVIVGWRPQEFCISAWSDCLSSGSLVHRQAFWMALQEPNQATDASEALPGCRPVSSEGVWTSRTFPKDLPSRTSSAVKSGGLQRYIKMADSWAGGRTSPYLD